MLAPPAGEPHTGLHQDQSTLGVIIPLHLGLLGCTWNKVFQFLVPPNRRTEGGWETGEAFPEELSKCFVTYSKCFLGWDLQGGWGNWQVFGVFLSSKEKTKVCFNNSLHSLKGSFKGDRVKFYKVVTDGKRRRTRQEFVPEEDQSRV